MSIIKELNIDNYKISLNLLLLKYLDFDNDDTNLILEILNYDCENNNNIFFKSFSMRLNVESYVEHFNNNISLIENSYKK